VGFYYVQDKKRTSPNLTACFGRELNSMARKTHIDLKKPKKRGVKIWRYMDFDKFVALLFQQSLFFNRANLFEDEFEASISNKDVEYIKTITVQNVKEKMNINVFVDEQKKMGNIFSEEDLAFWENFFNRMYVMIPQLASMASSIYRKYARRYSYVNCWHVNEQESTAMWKLYASSHQAIAIQSTFSQLNKSLPCNFDESPIYLGLVNYIDYENERVLKGDIQDLLDPLKPLAYKRKSFEHERELRAAFQMKNIFKEQFKIFMNNQEEIKELSLKRFSLEELVDRYLLPTPAGYNVNVDLKKLIENVYVSPYSPSWFVDTVQDVISKYGFSFNVKHSGIGRSPIF
jgi:hypothetical protein